MKTHGKEKGFSAIEWIVYIALFAALSVFLINTLLLMLRAYTETRVNRELMNSAQVSLERMTREIRTAESINTGGSVFDSASGVLSLNTTTAGGGSTTVQFSLSGGGLRLTEGGVLSGNLTGEKVSVTSLVFRNITTASGSAVRVEMTLLSLRSPSAKTVTIYDTVTLRGSYE